MIKAVIFDLDDTLYDEIDYCRSGFAAVAEYLAVHVLSQDEQSRIFQTLWSIFIAGNKKTTFNAALKKLRIEPTHEMISTLIQIYRTHKPDITLPAESLQLLGTIKTQYHTGLLTDGFLPAQQYKVQALDIEKFFEHIIYTESLGRQFWKPSPKGFQILLDKLNVSPENTVYIADNPEKDFIAPNELNMHSIQIDRQRRIHAPIYAEKNALPSQSADSIANIPDMINLL